MANEPYTSGFIEWASHIAQIAGAAAFGWIFRTNTQVSRLEYRMKAVEKRDDERTDPIYGTQRKVDLLESEVGHLAEKVDELRKEHRKTSAGVAELLVRVPKP